MTAKRGRKRASLREPYMPKTPPFLDHGLEPVVRAAFARGPHQDRVSLALFLRGGPGGPEGPPGFGEDFGYSHYKYVAEDALNHMFAQGKLVRDRMGWYVVNPDYRPPTPTTP